MSKMQAMFVVSMGSGVGEEAGDTRELSRAAWAPAPESLFLIHNIRGCGLHGIRVSCVFMHECMCACVSKKNKGPGKGGTRRNR